MAQASNFEHHPFRTFLAAIFGIIGFCLVLVSILVFWLHTTLFSTSSFIAAVAPLPQNPAVQTFLAAKATDTLLDKAPLREVAPKLLPEQDVATLSDEQLAARLRPIVEQSIIDVLKSPRFASIWKDTIQSSHAAFVAQLNQAHPSLSLDLTDAVTGILQEFNATKLGSITVEMSKDMPTLALDLEGSRFDQIHTYYLLVKQGMLVLLFVTLLMLLLSIGISVHHVRTLRRIFFGVGVLALCMTLLLRIEPMLSTRLTGIEQQTAVAAASVLVHGLQTVTLIIAIVGIGLSLLSKLYPKTR